MKGIPSRISSCRAAPTKSQLRGDRLSHSRISPSASSSRCRWGLGETHVGLCFILQRDLRQLILSCTLAQHLQKAACCTWVPGFCFYACLSWLQQDEMPGTSAGGFGLLVVYGQPPRPFVREAAQLVLTASAVKLTRFYTEMAQTTVL